ncbi:MAG: DUF5946 family protein [Caldilineaceae bacterium]
MVAENEVRPTCPECGAPLVDGMTCWEQLGGILAWEVHDPELQAEHFLTVAIYNLQHPDQFTDEALAGLRIALIDYLDYGVTAEKLRQRASRAYEGKWRVRKAEAERRPVLRRWRRTVADVYLPDQPQGAAGRVRAWAMAVRSELDVTRDK